MHSRNVSSCCFECPVCRVKEASSAAMTAHCQRMHLDVHTLARCCGDVFFTRNMFQKHCGQNHPDSHVCAQCKGYFPSEMSLQSHRTAYVKYYVCPMCDCQETKLSNLVSHVGLKHGVILDQRYVITILEPPRKTAPRSRSRLFLRKVLNVAVPCCRGCGLDGSAESFDGSYSCGLVSEDFLNGTLRDSFYTSWEEKYSEKPESGVDEQLLPLEMGQSASQFFDLASESPRPDTSDLVKVKKLWDDLLTKVAAAMENI